MMRRVWSKDGCKTGTARRKRVATTESVSQGNVDKVKRQHYNLHRLSFMVGLTTVET
jgi:hypothetical protein